MYLDDFDDDDVNINHGDYREDPKTAGMSLEERLAHVRTEIENSLHYYDEYWERPEDRPPYADALANQMYEVLYEFDTYLPEAWPQSATSD